jgi:hypothetical protein
MTLDLADFIIPDDVEPTSTIGSSVLAVDFGSVHTRAVLLDIVEGTYRLVARGETRTTDGFPVNDPAVGLSRAVKQLEQITGRALIRDSGQIITPETSDRSGVDLFLVTASVGRPLRAVLIGLMPDVSVMSALRATTGNYVDVGAILSLDDGRTEEERLNAILLSFPDVILISGGTDRGAEAALTAMIETARLAVSLIDRSRRPIIIYAGNAALSSAVQQMFEGLASVQIAANLRPSLEDERLDSARAQLSMAFDRYKETRSANFVPIAEMSGQGILPTAQSNRTIVDYLGRTRRGGVLAVDVGSAVSSLSLAFGAQAAHIVRTDAGLGHNAVSLLETVGINSVRRWLPLALTDSDLRNFVATKSLRPATIPATLRDLYIEYGMLRATIETMLSEARSDPDIAADQSSRLIIGSGAALINTGSPGLIAMLLADSLTPTGITTLWADPYGLLPALGALAPINPQAVVQLLETENLQPLGTLVSLGGRPRRDRAVMKVRIKLDSGETIRQTIAGGHLWVYPLPLGAVAQVSVRVRGRLTVGGKRRLRFRATGGTAGLIFDARGRPLPLPSDLRALADQLALWMSEATGDPPLTLDERLLTLAEKHRDDSRRADKASPDRKRRRGRKKGQPEDGTPDDIFADDLAELETSEDEDDLGALRRVLS